MKFRNLGRHLISFFGRRIRLVRDFYVLPTKKKSLIGDLQGAVIENFAAASGADGAIKFCRDAFTDQMGRRVGENEIASAWVEAEEPAHAIQIAAIVVRDHIDRNIHRLSIDRRQNIIGRPPLTVIASVLRCYCHHRSTATEVTGKVDSIEICFGPDLAHFDSRSASGRCRGQTRSTGHLTHQDRIGGSVWNVRECGAAVDAEDATGFFRIKPRVFAHAKCVVASRTGESSVVFNSTTGRRALVKRDFVPSKRKVDWIRPWQR